jgi:O-methyltransferase involved in polyketide biosynthesis
MIIEAVEGGITRIVNLGSGLDTRPYRLELDSDLDWIEADLAPVNAFKAEALHDQVPRCRLSRFDIDLTDKTQWQGFLDYLGASPKPSLILSEGVMMYLDDLTVGHIAHSLYQENYIKYWIIDYFSDLYRKIYQNSTLARNLKDAAPMRFHPNDWHRFFKDYGWDTEAISYLGMTAKTLNRPLPRPPVFDIWPFSLMLKFMLSLTPKNQTRKHEQMVGYARLKKVDIHD